MSGKPFQARVARVVSGLRRLYPDVTCELRHESALQLLVATILSAQCTDRRVNLVTPVLFAKYKTAGDYAAADTAELEALIHSTGFFRNKAKAIVGLAKALLARHDGAVPDTMDGLVALPGVGRKTANVVLAEWFHRPAIPVDTHVQRLCGRLELTGETGPVKIEFALQKLLLKEDWSFTASALIRHGRRVCFARDPACATCALRADCPFPGRD